jgi:hypothetical protein
MRLQMSGLLLSLLLVMLGSGRTLAQGTGSNTESKSDTRTITGCLSKQDASSKEYRLTANDGSTWEVRSETVPLAGHVGHTVTATGVIKNATAHNLKEDAKGATADAHLKKDNFEHGHMTITDLKMVSGSCEK